MASVASKRKEALASTARTASENSLPISLPPDATDIGIVIKTTAFTSGTFTAQLQTSFDGTTWLDVAGAVSTAIAATGEEHKFASAPCLAMVRIELVGATTPVATNEVFIVYGQNN